MLNFDFSLDKQKEILRIALLYRMEAKKCYSTKAYLAGCIMMGAALEALLLASLNSYPPLILDVKGVPKKDGKIKNFEDWKLNELIRVAEYLGWFPSSISSDEEWDTAKAKIGDYAKIVQHLRNYIHPVRYAKEVGRGRITKKYLDACFNIVDNAAAHLSKVLNNNLTILREEKEKRNNETKS